jgi:hypothetical protein
MEDTLITFETAKLAKEKGFEFKVVWEYILGFKNNHERDKYLPTQSQLAKWLREKHNIHLIAYKNINIDGYDWCFITTDGITNINSYKTYEEAYEIGLQEALKLINNK